MYEMKLKIRKSIWVAPFVSSNMLHHARIRTIEHFWKNDGYLSLNYLQAFENARTTLNSNFLGVLCSSLNTSFIWL